MATGNDYWSGLMAFARAADTGSFTAAAKRCGMTPSAVSKAISRLEGRLGVRLFQRSTRNLALTQEGVAFHELIGPALKVLEDAEGQIQSARAPRGLLRVTAPIDLGRTLIASWISQLSAEYDALRLELNVTDRFVDLTRERYDLAIRMGQPVDSRLTMRSLGALGYAVVASPDYFARRGRPSSPADLRGHACLRYLTLSGQPLAWTFDGEDVGVFDGPFDSDDGGALRTAALHGAGVAYLLRTAVDDDLAHGSLVEVFASTTKPEVPVYALHAFGDKLPMRARVFIDFVRRRLSPA